MEQVDQEILFRCHSNIIMMKSLLRMSTNHYLRSQLNEFIPSCITTISIAESFDIDTSEIRQLLFERLQNLRKEEEGEESP